MIDGQPIAFRGDISLFLGIIWVPSSWVVSRKVPRHTENAGSAWAFQKIYVHMCVLHGFVIIHYNLYSYTVNICNLNCDCVVSRNI